VAEAFVYITLPGKVTPITAGRFVMETARDGGTLGRFVYGRRYLENPDAVEIDPVEPRLSRRTYETAALGGVFGALRDANPDYWGRRVIDKHAGKAPLAEIDYLLKGADDRAGALGFGLNAEPPAPRRDFNQSITLETLQRIADALIADENLGPDALTQQIEDLLLIGTSMGGARPKAVVEDKEALWIAKFNRLSPAYDLTPATPISLERRDLALVIGDAGRIATAANLISQCGRLLLKADEAAAIVADMEQRVMSNWYDVARGAGVSVGDCEMISGAFVYPGFRSAGTFAAPAKPAP